MKPAWLRHKPVSIICLALLSFPACLVRRRVVAPAGKQQNRPLLSATKEDLIQRIHGIFDPIQFCTEKVDMSPSVGNLYGGQVTDYATISGYILFEKPDSIRVIGLDPVIHSIAFDMVSTGNDFRVLIPPKNLFIEGNNNAPANSSNKLENLRPIAFLTSLIISPPDPQNDLTFVEDDTDESKAVYILFFLRRDQDQARLKRIVYFDRHTLQIVRQKTFTPSGETTSQSRYSNWKAYNNVQFPSEIDIQRPLDGYEVILTTTDMKMNTGQVTPDKFVLNKPPNAKLRELR
jgi:outer membrane lipoprotein-sorting protein